MKMKLRRYSYLFGPIRFLRDRFDLSMDKADEIQTIDYIRKNVEFKGTNLWILIFAIFVASVGLNVNSTAVIIGAMLISPLMGPIIGVGMGVGINDFELIKKSLKNLAVAIVISVITSATYFLISPLSDAQSELLARTTPTIYDVFIALFGGFAGIVAGSSREKSNAIPGVAIATALMPPLCTAGYGIATGNLYYFLGAFYLFFINSVFISLSTFLIVRFLKYPKKQFMDQQREKRVKSYIIAFVILTVIPSVYLGLQVVQQSIFERNASVFLDQELTFEKSRIISKSYDFKSNPKIIEVSFFGEKVEDVLISNAKSKMEDYKLKDVELKVFQGYESGDPLDIATVERMNMNLRSGIIEDLYKKNEALLATKDEQIQILQREIITMKQMQLPLTDISNELKAQHSNVKEFAINSTIITNFVTNQPDTTYLAFASFTSRPSRAEITRMENWLKARIKSEKLKLVIN
ncbi:TIGR00341 family protein [Fulvivirgaceae bacterium LMO-SS25]